MGDPLNTMGEMPASLATTGPAGSPLTDKLPPELRIHIYGEVLRADSPLIITFYRSSVRNTIRQSPRSTSCTR